VVTNEVPEKIRAFLLQPHPAVMATVTKDGHPVTAATWYVLESDGRVMINLDAGRLRLNHLRREPRFALDVMDADDWYSHVALQLEVADIQDDTGLADIDTLSRHYLGSAYPNRDRPRVSVRAAVTKWMAWGAIGGR
jgi:PPOX class probable F420-dependent enzyme